MNIIPFPQRPEMSLEQLESSCLDYLSEAKNPVVPVDLLVEFCRRVPEMAQVSRDTVLDFLRAHEDVEVLEAATPDAVPSADMLAEAGIPTDERAVLKRRIPTQREMHAIMALQLQEMKAALAEVSGEVKDDARRGELEDAVARVEHLLQRLGTIMR